MKAINDLERLDAVPRLWERDATLFSEDDQVIRLVQNRLGWLGLASEAGALTADAQVFASEVWEEGLTDVVLLGMGGSSLAPLVMSRVLPTPDDRPRLTVLDTSSPLVTAGALRTLDPSTTVCVVASKSGGTVEPLSLYAVFRAWFEQRGVEPSGHLVAITDPGSPLEDLAESQDFRRVFSTPADVGGRYSALTAFGLVPTALIGADLDALLDSARAMEDACRRDVGENPGAHLAAWMIDSYRSGRDKLTLRTSPGLESFGLWVEQLVAESTGKLGRGLVPVVESSVAPVERYGQDRMVAVVRDEDDLTLSGWADEMVAEAPVTQGLLRNAHDLGAEFVRWEVAVALAGVLMEIDPFDEPNVTEAKQRTSAILEGHADPPEAGILVDGVEVTVAAPVRLPDGLGDLGSVLAPLLDDLSNGEYLALLAYMPEDTSLTTPLRRALDAVSDATGNATCLQLGPRYLHSTGQLHKGGPNKGVFVVLTFGDQPEVPVPGTAYSLGDLHRAQADGDMVTLASHGRRVVGLHAPATDIDSVQKVADAFIDVAGSL